MNDYSMMGLSSLLSHWVLFYVKFDWNSTIIFVKDFHNPFVDLLMREKENKDSRFFCIISWQILSKQTKKGEIEKWESKYFSVIYSNLMPKYFQSHINIRFEALLFAFILHKEKNNRKNLFKLLTIEQNIYFYPSHRSFSLRNVINILFPLSFHEMSESLLFVTDFTSLFTASTVKQYVKRFFQLNGQIQIDMLNRYKASIPNDSLGFCCVDCSLFMLEFYEFFAPLTSLYIKIFMSPVNTC